jgi:hypothetical protein
VSLENSVEALVRHVQYLEARLARLEVRGPLKGEFGAVTLDQGANDTAILSLQSSDVAHGITDWADTDTFANAGKYSATEGGVSIRGFSENVAAVQILGAATNDDTTKSAAGLAPVILRASKKTGTTIGAVGADGNLVAIRNGTNTRWIVDEDGDTWQQGNFACNNVAPAAPATYTPSNVSADRAFDANSTSLDELADVVGTLIADLKLTGLVA